MARKKERFFSSHLLLGAFLDLWLKGFLSNTIINIKLKIYEQKVFYACSNVTA